MRQCYIDIFYFELFRSALLRSWCYAFALVNGRSNEEVKRAEQSTELSHIHKIIVKHDFRSFNPHQHRLPF